MIKRFEAAADAQLDAITRAIVARWAPRRVILFGSRARGDHRPDSDYDLMIVIDSAASVDECERAIRAGARSAGVSADVSVASTPSFERRRVDVGTLEYAADREGLVLYADSESTSPRQVREQGAIPESFGEWIQRAESDYLTMERDLAPPPITDGAAFHAHQCAEKNLKAGLILLGVQPPRTHVLMDLLESSDAILRQDTGVARACELLDKLYPMTRYPKERTPTAEEAAQAADAAMVVRTAVRRVTRA